MANAQTEQREKKTVWQWLCWAGDRYFIKAMSSMALGLFASLIIGLIPVSYTHLTLPTTSRV